MAADERNKKIPVMFDRATQDEVCEDVYDALLAAQRADEPDESWESVKQHLKEIGKLR